MCLYYIFLSVSAKFIFWRSVLYSKRAYKSYSERWLERVINKVRFSIIYICIKIRHLSVIIQCLLIRLRLRTSVPCALLASQYISQTLPVLRLDFCRDYSIYCGVASSFVAPETLKMGYTLGLSGALLTSDMVEVISCCITLVRICVCHLYRIWLSNMAHYFGSREMLLGSYKLRWDLGIIGVV